MPILLVFETDVFIVQEGFFAMENVENLFFTSYFYDLLHGNTEGYKGLQGVTSGGGCYKRLQGITRGDRGLQGVTGDYKGLYKLFF